MTNVTVLGAGAWGTALAMQAYAAGNKVTLWAYLLEEKEEIDTFGENKSRLPGVKIPKDITVTCDLAAASKDANVFLVVTPAQVIRPFLETLKPHIPEDAYVVFCSKGIEIKTGDLMSEICAQVIPDISIAVLSGPNFAKEIAHGAPGAATLATKEISRSRWLSKTLSSSTFRIYPSDDIMGTQIGGSLKNVIAIASGLATGANLGENARAALITRGLAEMARFGEHKGANKETFMGLSGMGDLVLCCTSKTSRNMNFGVTVGQAKDAQKALKESTVLTEGAHTAKAIYKISVAEGLDLPICTAVYNILYNGKAVAEEMVALLTRPQKSEIIAE